MGFDNDFPKDSVSSQFSEGPRKQGLDFKHVYRTPFENLDRTFDAVSKLYRTTSTSTALREIRCES